MYVLSHFDISEIVIRHTPNTPYPPTERERERERERRKESSYYLKKYYAHFIPNCRLKGGAKLYSIFMARKENFCKSMCSQIKVVGMCKMLLDGKWLPL